MADDSTSAKPAWWVRAEKNIIRTHGLKGPHLDFFSDDAKWGAQVALSPSVSISDDINDMILAAIMADRERVEAGRKKGVGCEVATSMFAIHAIITAFLRARADALGVKQE